MLTLEELEVEHVKLLEDDPKRVAALEEEVRRVSEVPPGDYLELGVHVGLTLKVIYWAMPRDQVLYGCDTFSGFDEEDVAAEREFNDGAIVVAGNFSPTSAEGVRRHVGGSGEGLILIEGRFPESFEAHEDRLWRFVHVDVDLYAPTQAAVTLLWPRVVPGGAMMFHDYGCEAFPGVKHAVDRLCEEAGVPLLRIDDSFGTALLRKPG